MAYLKQYRDERAEFHDLCFLDTDEKGAKKLVRYLSKKFKVSQCPIRFESFHDSIRAIYSYGGVYKFHHTTINVQSIAHEVAHHVDHEWNGSFADRNAHTKVHYKLVRRACNYIRKGKPKVKLFFNEDAIKSFCNGLSNIPLYNHNKIKIENQKNVNFQVIPLDKETFIKNEELNILAKGDRQ